MPIFNKSKIQKLKKIDSLVRFFFVKKQLQYKSIANEKNIKNILIITFFLIGDTIIYLPALRVIRKNYPQSKVILIGGKAVKTILEGQNIFNDFVTVDCPWIAPFNKSLKNLFNFLSGIFIVNKKGKYDLAIDFRGDWRNIFFMNFIHSSQKLSYNASGGEYMLTNTVVPNNKIIHYLEEGLYLLERVGLSVSAEDHFPQLSLNDEQRLYLEGKKSELNPLGKIVIGIHPGVSASQNARKWDEMKYALLLETIRNQFGNISFVVYEGPNEGSSVNVIKDYLYKKNIHINIIKEGFTNYLILLNLSDILICNDSGAGHIAAAYSIPSVVIFGKGDPAAIKPIGKNIIKIISHELECKPCNQHVCPLGTNECIKSVMVDEVFAATQDILVNIKNRN